MSSLFYVKNGVPFIPTEINPELSKLARAIVKAQHLSLKYQMKANALQNAVKNGDKEQMLDSMQKCLEKNKALYNKDMSLSGAEIAEVDEAFFDDKDEEFFKNQLNILIDFAAINTVVTSHMMPLMTAACDKLVGKPINEVLFFSNQNDLR